MAEPRTIQIVVQDHGIGLPAAAAERIFEPFSRATNAEQLQITGMGLGLFICRNIIEQHHGRIWARSAGEGTGTVISVWLPERSPSQTTRTRGPRLNVPTSPNRTSKPRGSRAASLCRTLSATERST